MNGTERLEPIGFQRVEDVQYRRHDDFGSPA
jgi:hypothetical protein